ncbi:hypothetical protein BVRB_3g056970 [Beta vulgaris subsp. vulgaris]|nr:hypothetical protein BVRB_3g056970 [Beta vulgaris subsp. vulgaris]
MLILLFISTQKSENFQHHHPNLPVFRQPPPACPLAGADQTRATIPLPPPRLARHSLFLSLTFSLLSSPPPSRCTLCPAWAAAAPHLPPATSASPSCRPSRCCTATCSPEL